MGRIAWLGFAAVVAWLPVIAQAQDPTPPPPPPTSVRPWYPTAVRSSSDRIPPSPPQLQCVLVWRGWGEHGAQSENGCIAHRGFIQFEMIGARDNETPADGLGYRFEYIDGAMPENLTIFPDCFALPPTRELYLVWDDGATWEQDEFVFRVAVRAIDQAGNESNRSNVLIVGNDGDMEYMHRMADTAFSRAAFTQSESAARAHRALSSAAVLDTVTARASSPLPETPRSIEQVYDEATRRAIGGLTALRIDRVEWRALTSQGSSTQSPYRLEGYYVKETGRVLSNDELFQLRTLLLDPRSYIGDKWACADQPEYAFSTPGNAPPTFIQLGKRCFGVGVHGPDLRTGGDLTREASSILRSFCEALFRFDPLK